MGVFVLFVKTTQKSYTCFDRAEIPFPARKKQQITAVTCCFVGVIYPKRGKYIPFPRLSFCLPHNGTPRAPLLL